MTFLLGLALTTGAWTADFCFERSAVLLYALLYVISLLSQYWIMGGKHYDPMDLPEEERERIKALQSIYFCGSNLEVETDKQDKNVLEFLLDPKRVLFRKIISYGILILWGVCAWRYGVPLTGVDVLFFASALILTQSASFGHQLTALSLNAIGATYCLSTLPGNPVFPALVYGSMLLLVLLSHRHVELAIQAGQPVREWLQSRRKAIANRTLALLGGIAVVGYLFNSLLPADLPKLNPKKWEEEAVEAGMNASRSLGKLAAKRVRDYANEPVANKKVEKSSEPARDSTVSPEKLISLAQKLKTLAPGSADSTERPPSPESDVEPGANAQHKISIEDAKKLLEQLKQLGLHEPMNREIEQKLEAAQHTKASTDSSQVTLSDQQIQTAVKALEAAASASPIEVTAAVPSAPPIEAAVRTTPTTVAEPKFKPADSKPAEIQSEPLVSEATLRKLLHVLKMLAVIGAVILLGLLLQKLLARYRPEDVKEESATLDVETSKRLREQLRALEKQSLSPETEIIQRYHLFLSLAHELQRGRPESLPPTEYGVDISSRFPSVATPVQTCTSVFCDVYYGRFEVAAKVLTDYRQQHRKIFRHWLYRPSA